MNVLSYLAYPPIVRGFIVLLVAGAAFPLTGVFVLRLNLITLRFMLMHGTLLGGAVALGIGADPLYVGMAMNVALVIVMSRVADVSGTSLGHVTAFFMVLTIGLAFAVIYRFEVPAKDALSILWGNLFAMDTRDIVVTTAFSLVLVGLLLVFYRKLKAVVYNREIAFTSGVPDRTVYFGILIVTALTIAFAMKLIGALLLDALLLLPAIVATTFARSTRAVFIVAAALGFASSFIGFFTSLALDIPASSAVTIVAAVMLGAGLLVRRRIRAAGGRTRGRGAGVRSTRG